MDPGGSAASRLCSVSEERNGKGQDIQTLGPSYRMCRLEAYTQRFAQGKALLGLTPDR